MIQVCLGSGLRPAWVRLRSLGRHHLPGLFQSLAFFEVDAIGVLSGFPRLRIG
jgi:hypothetical protein